MELTEATDGRRRTTAPGHWSRLILPAKSTLWISAPRRPRPIQERRPANPNKSPTLRQPILNLAARRRAQQICPLARLGAAPVPSRACAAAARLFGLRLLPLSRYRCTEHHLDHCHVLDRVF